MINILVDTCFWYALYDARDNDHLKAKDLLDILELGNIIVPHPTLYETINTRFTRNRIWVQEFESIIKKKNTKIIEDDQYKQNALLLTIESTLYKNRPISLVDMVIRLMLDDVNLKIDYLLTFNAGDFIDLCHKNRISIINQE